MMSQVHSKTFSHTLLPLKVASQTSAGQNHQYKLSEESRLQRVMATSFQKNTTEHERRGGLRALIPRKMKALIES